MKCFVFLIYGLFLFGCVAQKTDISLQNIHQTNVVTSSQEEMAEEMAIVLSVKPKVNYTFEDHTENVTKGMLVPLSATLHSNATGKATLKLPDKSIVSLEPNSEIELAEFEQSQNTPLDSTKVVSPAYQISIGIRGMVSN